MTARKPVKKVNTNTAVFGYTEINSTSLDALSNNYCNVAELRRELQGKPISENTILTAMAKVGFSKYGDTCGIHSFFPDAGKCFVGCKNYNNNSIPAAVVISWKVPSTTDIAVEKLTCVLEKLLEKL